MGACKLQVTMNNIEVSGLGAFAPWIVVLLILASSIWVYFDATRLGARKGLLKGGFTDMGPGGWLAACLGLWLVSFPLYLSCRSKIQAAAGSSSKSASSTTPADFTDRLEKLADLRAKGVLTEDEFNDQKSRLLEM